MSDSQVWLQHLASSLRASRQLAYLYRVGDDSFDFLGDVLGILGCSEEETPKAKVDFSDLVAEEDRVSRQLAIANAIGQCQQGEDKNFIIHYRLKRHDSSLVPMIETGVARKDAKDGSLTVQGLVAIDNETIERQKKITRKMGFRESVSSSFLGNKDRQQLLHRVEEILSDTERDAAKGFMLLIGADRISLVNEVYGSVFTDELLEKIGENLKTMLGDKGDYVRISGDGYALIFPHTTQGEMGGIAQNILSAFYSHPMLIRDRTVHQVVSIGGVRFDENELAAASVLGRAELALGDAKRKGRGCFIEYSERLGEEVKSFKDVLSIGDSFLKSFRDGRVRIAFQGIVNSRTRDISFYECLIRMIDEKGEVHSAGRFIEAVEKMGLTRLVDTFATKEAIRELKEFSDISLSVNVSNHTLTDPDWIKAITSELRDYPDVARRLIVEITESVAMSDVNQSLRVVRMLQSLGCRIALDDFGVGQTAFTQLKDLSLDIVKIDKSFIREMDKEENKLFIKTLHSLASAMNLETVGEGAETHEEAEILTRDGIDHIQGFVHGLPSMERLWLSQK